MTNRTTPEREAGGRPALLATAPCGSSRDAPRAGAATGPARVDLPAGSSSRGRLGGAATASDRAAATASDRAAATAAAGGPARPESSSAPGRSGRLRALAGGPRGAPASLARAGFLAMRQRRPCRAKAPPRSCGGCRDAASVGKGLDGPALRGEPGAGRSPRLTHNGGAFFLWPRPRPCSPFVPACLRRCRRCRAGGIAMADLGGFDD